ncbi:MAG: hypothetical protein RL375_1994 [Pseudomonadota bacterium]|jgi:hypothetical protein
MSCGPATVGASDRRRLHPVVTHRTMSSSVWILAAAAITALLGLAFALIWRSGADARDASDLPEDWPLAQRPLFTLAERELYHRLQAALPQRVILAKMPLVRFCQPLHRKELSYWFNLLGPLHVSFVVCNDQGRVLAAVDIERDQRPASRRAATIKQAVLATCRVRYLKCPEDQLATAGELQVLVPSSIDAPRANGSASSMRDGKATLAHAVRARRGEHHVRWYESGYNQDSFFAPDSRMDGLRETERRETVREERDSPLTSSRGGRKPPPSQRFFEAEPDDLRPDPGESPWSNSQPAAPSRRPAFVFDEQQLAYRRR